MLPNFTKARQTSDLRFPFPQLWWADVLHGCLSAVSALYRELRVQPQSCESYCMKEVPQS